MKVIIVKVMCIIIIALLNSCGNSTLKNADSVEEANGIIDSYILKWDETYQGLCDKPRNDNLKGQFQSLSESIASISGSGEACIKLSYSEQSEVSDYAINELEKRIHLMNFYNYNKIDCW